LNLTP